MPVVYPVRGEDKRTAVLLLSLADDPRDVGTSTDDGFAFIVPDYLYAKYVAGNGVVSEPAGPADAGLAKRRPGRPRKVQPDVEGE
ncbi:MAG: hypothetical protein ACREIE_00575 [Nitrospiraceae bacterium]